MSSGKTQTQRFATQRVDGPRYIQPFASRRDDRLGGAMDIAQSQVRNNQRPVDGWVWGNAEDHFRKANASSSVGWASVPPEARVEREPHTVANRKDVFSSQRLR